MNSDKQWLKQPGECHDKNGIPIYAGDLLRTPHFRTTRRKMHYLYHVVVFDTCGGLRMVSTVHMDETLRNHPDHRGGCPLLSDELAQEAEVISGVSVDGKMWNERPRVKVVYE